MAHNEAIKQRLTTFFKNNRIPNIIFHGYSSSERSDMIMFFINMIYHHDKSKIKANVMYMNCAHGKGIKFIREELKSFAKTNIQYGDSPTEREDSVDGCGSNSNSNRNKNGNGNGNSNSVNFKSIVLLNADSLSADAQSALRRSIEVFSFSSRFFLVVENKNKLLKPILSRFCILHISQPLPTTENNMYELMRDDHDHYHRDHHDHHDHHHRGHDTTTNAFRLSIFDCGKHRNQVHEIFDKYSIDVLRPSCPHRKVMQLVSEIYDVGLSSFDLVDYLKWKISSSSPSRTHKHQEIVHLQLCFEKVRTEFRYEKMLMYYIMNYTMTSTRQTTI